jgi:2-phospho-L-lactate guanylyltransferase
VRGTLLPHPALVASPAACQRVEVPRDAVEYVAIIPVKPLREAKSRLAVTPRLRRRLAAAFALDTVSAVLRCSAVARALVVTSDPRIRAVLRRYPVEVLDDRHPPSLPAAVDAACLAAASRHAGRPTVVVPADLPALDPEDLADVLTPVREHGCYVPDAAGMGTTLLLRSPGSLVPSRYGPDSASLHRQAGLAEIEHAPLSVRRDVDDLDDLRAAMLLGVGLFTTAVVSSTHVLGNPRTKTRDTRSAAAEQRRTRRG